MIVSMWCTDSSLLEFHFYKHHLSIVTHDLAYHSFTCRFPYYFFFKNEGVTSCLFHFASQINYFTGKYTININFSTDCDFFYP